MHQSHSTLQGRCCKHIRCKSTFKHQVPAALTYTYASHAFADMHECNNTACRNHQHGSGGDSKTVVSTGAAGFSRAGISAHEATLLLDISPVHARCQACGSTSDCSGTCTTQDCSSAPTALKHKPLRMKAAGGRAKGRGAALVAQSMLADLSNQSVSTSRLAPTKASLAARSRKGRCTCGGSTTWSRGRSK